MYLGKERASVYLVGECSSVYIVEVWGASVYLADELANLCI